MIYKMGELFCGPSGLAWGALNADIGDEKTKIVHAWANDIEPFTCQTYSYNICKENNSDTVICKDVRNLEISRNNLSDIDAFSFGFPCNDFSVVGEQKGFNGNYGALYTYDLPATHRDRMIYHYLPEIQNYSSSNFPLKFFSYIAGGFSNNISKPLNEIVKNSSVSGSAMPVTVFIKMIEKNSFKPYTHEEIKNIFSLNRQVSISDLI